jgi:hypothetical protein
MTAGRNRPWTAQEVARVLEECPNGKASYAVAVRLGSELDRTAEAIKVKLSLLVPTIVQDGHDGRGVDKGNFAEAMMAAVNAGLEHPPMIPTSMRDLDSGMDRRPCTRHPVFIENLRSQMESDVLLK